MSSILEALKKLEDEKAARRSGTGNLAGKVVKTGRRVRQTPPWLLPGSMLAVAIVSVLITYLAMNGISSHRSEPPSGAKPLEGLPITETRLPPVGAPVTDAMVNRNPVLPPGYKAEAAPYPPPVIPARKASPTTPNADANRELPATAALANSPAANSGAPLPKLILAGIAWQKDNTYRMAIVNSTPVREGGIVEGATVKEILADRVRFSLNGMEFEVILEK